MNNCNHNERNEYISGVLHIQKCSKCGLVREYNPYHKKHILVTSPYLWSEWSNSHDIIDKLFLKK
jgi:hypothetical protein